VRAAPTVDFLYFPGQAYPGHPWSDWGDSLAVAGKYYASIGDHLAPKGNAFVNRQHRCRLGRTLPVPLDDRACRPRIDPRNFRVLFALAEQLGMLAKQTPGGLSIAAVEGLDDRDVRLGGEGQVDRELG
jgi:hypothetical protein